MVAIPYADVWSMHHHDKTRGIFLNSHVLIKSCLVLQFFILLFIKVYSVLMVRSLSIMKS